MEEKNPSTRDGRFDRVIEVGTEQPVVAPESSSPAAPSEPVVVSTRDGSSVSRIREDS